MPRRSHHKAGAGTVYCVEWPEWHVECGHEGCGKDVLVAGLGEAQTAKQANDRMRKGGAEHKSRGWVFKDGRWYCPDHGGGR